MEKKNISVLVVDDQLLVRDGIASLLAIQPGICIIGTAENGKKAIEVVNDKNPDVILMDVRMPVMDGVEATQLILQNKPSQIILMLTTLEDDEYIVKSLKSGARGYLLKDMAATDLAQSIQLSYRGVFQMAPSVAGRLVNLNDQKVTTNEENDFSDQIAELTPREMDVLKLIANGDTNKEIAQTLYLSEGTVKNIVSKIFMRLGTRDRVQAAIIAIRNGIG